MVSEMAGPALQVCGSGPEPSHSWSPKQTSCRVEIPLGISNSLDRVVSDNLCVVVAKSNPATADTGQTMA
jgi:hypothetical protein